MKFCSDCPVCQRRIDGFSVGHCWRWRQRRCSVLRIGLPTAGAKVSTGVCHHGCHCSCFGRAECLHPHQRSCRTLVGPRRPHRQEYGRHPGGPQKDRRVRGYRGNPHLVNFWPDILVARRVFRFPRASFWICLARTTLFVSAGLPLFLGCRCS